MTVCHPTERTARDLPAAEVQTTGYGSEPLRWQVIGPACVPASVRDRWESLAAASDNPFGLYQSPGWFDHLAAVDDASLRLAYARDANDEVAAVVPCRIDRHGVPLQVARRYRLRTPPAVLVTILGGQPLMPMSGPAVAGLVEAVMGRSAGGFDLHGIDERSAFLRLLTDEGQGRRGFLHERRSGLDRIDLISLPGTFAEFMGRYGAKKRYNLRRQERLVRERAGGDCELERIEDPWQVPGFIDAIAQLRPPTRDEDASRYDDLARRGLLRGYVLRAAGRPIACITGKQHGSTYLIDRTTYDGAWGDLSPGSTLLHLAIEDLIETRSTARINLGYGCSKGSYPATNKQAAYRCSWLIRRSWANRGMWSLRELLRRGAGACGRATRRLADAERRRDVPRRDAATA